MSSKGVAPPATQLRSTTNPPAVDFYLRSSYGGRSARGRVLRFLRRMFGGGCAPFIFLHI